MIDTDHNGTKSVTIAGAVTLSFDDGWRSIYENAFPILQQSSIAATHYIISGYLDNSQYPHYMNLGQVRELERAGHEIGCHTVSHRHLLQEPVSLVESEVFLSKAFLSGRGFQVTTFAYPYGEYDDRVLDVVRRAGFSGARGVGRGYNDGSTDKLLLNVQPVKSSTTAREVVGWIEKAVADKTWLILMFHQVDYESREWSTTPEILREIVDFIKNQNVSTVTVNEGLGVL